MATHKRVGFCSIIVFLTLSGLSACRPAHAPVYAPTTEAGMQASGGQFTAKEIQTAVFGGLQAKGWRIMSQKNGEVEAETTSGGHTARVLVRYNATGWSIGYVSSSPGMKYQHDSKHGPIIHRRYNHWVRLLDEAIQRALPGRSSPTSGAEEPPPAAAP